MVQSLGHGGCERDAAKIAMGLDRERFQVHVGVLREGGFRVSEVVASGISVVHLPLTSFMNTSVLRAAGVLGSYVRKHDIRLIHCFDVPTDIFGAPAARWHRVPHVLTSQLSYRELVLPRERALLRVSDRLSDFVVVNSQAVGDSLVAEASLPADKVYLCYNGVDTSTFFPAPVPRPEALRDASVVIGSVCVMRPEKRVDWIVRAFADVFKRHQQARLLLVGSGTEVPRLQSLTRELGVEQACLFVPGQADVADWLRAIDVYINSSRSESFPNALLEAMACGCCVIGSRVGGIPELISHGQNGLTFGKDSPNELTEALEQVVADPAVRTRYREQAALTAKEHFSMKQNLERMDALYSQLLTS